MPVQVSYPGVYVEELPSGVRTITGVADLDHRLRRPRMARAGRRAGDRSAATPTTSARSAVSGATAR